MKSVAALEPPFLARAGSSSQLDVYMIGLWLDNEAKPKERLAFARVDSAP